MNCHSGTKILILIFIVTFASLGIKTTFPCTAPAIENLPERSTFSPSLHNPDFEMEVVYFPAASGGHLAVQKHVSPLLHLSSAAGHYIKISSSEKFHLKISSLLIKDYLSHIYPTHNFW